MEESSNAYYSILRRREAPEELAIRHALLDRLTSSQYNDFFADAWWDHKGNFVPATSFKKDYILNNFMHKISDLVKIQG